MGKPPTHLPSEFLMGRALVTSWHAAHISARTNIASRPTAPYDDKWGKGVIDPAFFTEIFYASLPGKLASRD